MMRPLPCGAPFEIEMGYIGRNVDGNLVVRVEEIHRRVYSLSDVKIYIGTDITNFSSVMSIEIGYIISTVI